MSYEYEQREFVSQPFIKEKNDGSHGLIYIFLTLPTPIPDGEKNLFFKFFFLHFFVVPQKVFMNALKECECKLSFTLVLLSEMHGAGRVKGLINI